MGDSLVHGPLLARRLFDPHRFQQLFGAQPQQAKLGHALEELKALLAITVHVRGGGGRPAGNLAVLPGRRDDLRDGLIQQRLVLPPAKSERRRGRWCR